MTEFSEKEMQESLHDAPEWLRDALTAQQVSPGFRERCREAAMVAYSMAAMRRTRESIGTIPDTLEHYVKDLANNAGIEMEPVLRWLGIKSLSLPELAGGRAYARLGKALGMKAAELVGHVAVSLGVAEGTATIAFAKQADEARAPLQGDLIFKHVQEALSPAMKHNLRLIEMEIRKEYESGS